MFAIVSGSSNVTDVDISCAGPLGGVTLGWEGSKRSLIGSWTFEDEEEDDGDGGTKEEL
jgi:hypothetical protein